MILPAGTLNWILTMMAISGGVLVALGVLITSRATTAFVARQALVAGATDRR